MHGDVLVVGSRGKTGSRLVKYLATLAVPTRRASRTPEESSEVLFDWARPETFAPAFKNIGAAYLVAPTDRADHADVMGPAIETAMKQGVRRFVLLSASSLEAGGPMMGAVHAILRDIAEEWCVLRPTWFMQNFTEQQHLPTIRDEDAIYTATGHGKVPFIDADDIAAAAAGALTAEDAPNADIVLTGPEALSYDEVAERLSKRLGRTIRHIGMSHEDFTSRLMNSGFDEPYAKALAGMDAAIAQGSEDRTTDGVHLLTGREPTDFSTFIAAHREVWH